MQNSSSIDTLKRNVRKLAMMHKATETIKLGDESVRNRNLIAILMTECIHIVASVARRRSMKDIMYMEKHLFTMFDYFA
jgi:hypothetical protein